MWDLQSEASEHQKALEVVDAISPNQPVLA
jgi:hypothetical protein